MRTLLALVLLAACATTQTGHLPAARNAVTATELATVADLHPMLDDALQVVRPAWMSEDVTVYVDHVRTGIRSLENVRTDRVETVARYHAENAPAEYPAARGWVLVVTQR